MGQSIRASSMRKDFRLVHCNLCRWRTVDIGRTGWMAVSDVSGWVIWEPEFDSSGTLLSFLNRSILPHFLGLVSSTALKMHYSIVMLLVIRLLCWVRMFYIHPTIATAGTYPHLVNQPVTDQDAVSSNIVKQTHL